MFHIRKNGKIKINSEYKYWEFIAFLSEHSPSFDYWSLDYPTCKEMAIGFRRYKINRKRHERQNSRFMQTYKWMQQQRQEREEENETTCI